MESVNSTNEQFETTEKRGFRFGRKKLEKKPLIGSKSNQSSNGAGNSSNLQPSSSTLIVEEECPESLPSSSIRSLKLLDGVFAPVSLSQFSSLLFLRVGFIVGNGGLLAALGLLSGAYAILFVTVLSVCAISTNGAIEGGGAYFMISRTLGPEFGGAIGIVFYIANVFSSALYTSGCVEGVVSGINLVLYPVPANVTNTTTLESFSPTSMELYGIAFAINFVLLCLCITGAKLFSKATVLLFASVLALTIVVIGTMLGVNHDIPIPIASNNHLNISNYSGNFTGPNVQTFQGNLWMSLSHDYTNNDTISLKTIFGVLFSGVTGIMAGANLSGELLSPGYSIPTGTIGGCLFTYLVYFVLFVVTAYTVQKTALLNNYIYMASVVYYFPAFIYLGVVLATLSASMSNMLGASRVFHAIVGDNILGPHLRPLISSNKCRCCGSCCNCLTKNEFLGPLLVTFILTSAVLAMGDMNSIAPYSSQFFLYSYAMVNLSTLMLVWAGAPNFRPQFKYFNIMTCLIGVLVNIFMMFYLQPVAATLCLFIFFTLTLVIYARHMFSPDPEMEWGSVAQAVIFHTVRKYLLKLDFRREHVKFWRPHLLLLVSNPRQSCPLIDTLNDLKKSGIYVLGHVQTTKTSPRDLTDEYNLWQEMVDHLKVKAFVTLTESDSLRKGAIQLVRVSGLGALKPNTVMLGFPDEVEGYDFLKRETSKYYLKPEKKTNITSDWFSVDEGNTRAAQKVLPREYVGLLQDILSVKKNIGLCRNFHLFDKTSIERRDLNHRNYIDVWPIDFMSPEVSRVEDTTSLFTLQLGTVLNMVSFWSRNTSFRVFLIVPSEWSQSLSSEQEQKVKDTLESVRINAKIEMVPFVQPRPVGGEENGEIPETNSSLSSVNLFSSTSSATSQDSPPPLTDQLLDRMTGRYLTAVNRMVRNYSKDAAVTFLNIPPPPSSVDHYEQYLEALTRLSDELGPTIMVHGISKVTTTTL